MRGAQRDEGGGEDGGGREIEVEREGNVCGEWVGGVCVGVWVDGRHFR